MLYVVKYSGPFGFIKPWTAVRDSETYSQQFLTPSILAGIERKLFPELLNSDFINEIKVAMPVNNIDEYSYDYEEDEYEEIENKLSNEPNLNDKNIPITNQLTIEPEMLDKLIKNIQNRLNEIKK